MGLGKENKDGLKLYRRRFIPEETVFLKHDVIIERTDEIIVTKWHTIKPRADFSFGCSVYYLKKGWKISKFYDVSKKFLYYYCDIIESEFFIAENKIVFSDLLADVVIFEDGRIKVLDLGEIPDAFDSGLINGDMAKAALRRLDALLTCIYNGELNYLCRPMDGVFER